MTTKTIRAQITFSLLLLFFISCKPKAEIKTISISEDLQLTKVSDYGYIHISKVFLDNGKQYACNGFLYMHNNEAYVFDTPANDIATEELINWLEKDQKTTIKGVIFNHFHRDCNEGMDVFKRHHIPCMASKHTAQLMKEKNDEQPDQIFENKLVLQLGSKRIINSFFGEAHSKDNIVSYFPEEQILFGGCMIKSLGASKGNLDDANVDAWSNTVTQIKNNYPKLQTVIPGHGKHGDSSLLDYTISLFKK